MKFKYIIITSALMFIGAESFSQTSEDYSALTEFLDQEKMENLENNPEKHAEVAFINRHGYHISQVGEKTELSIAPQALEIEKLFSQLPDLSESLILSGELNLIGYNFQLKRESYTYYRIGQSDNILVIPPMSLTLKRMEE